MMAYTEDEIRVMLSNMDWSTGEIDAYINRVKSCTTAKRREVIVTYRDEQDRYFIVHRYFNNDRCICGGEVVYHEDTTPPGDGCSADGKPWLKSVRLYDPQVRRAEGR
jgi:hypothetical protein